jgi:hypothetical protein
MKGHMERHVEHEKLLMFDEAVQHVQGLLKQLLKEVKEEMLTKVDHIFVGLERDYTAVVVGQEQGYTTPVLPREQRAIRKSVLGIVDGAELVFKRAVGLEPEPPVAESDAAEVDIKPEGPEPTELAADSQETPGPVVAAASVLNDSDNAAREDHAASQNLSAQARIDDERVDSIKSEVSEGLGTSTTRQSSSQEQDAAQEDTRNQSAEVAPALPDAITEGPNHEEAHTEVVKSETHDESANISADTPMIDATSA